MKGDLTDREMAAHASRGRRWWAWARRLPPSRSSSRAIRTQKQADYNADDRSIGRQPRIGSRAGRRLWADWTTGGQTGADRAGPGRYGRRADNVPKHTTADQRCCCGLSVAVRWTGSALANAASSGKPLSINFFPPPLDGPIPIIVHFLACLPHAIPARRRYPRRSPRLRAVDDGRNRSWRSRC